MVVKNLEENAIKVDVFECVDEDDNKSVLCMGVCVCHQHKHTKMLKSVTGFQIRTRAGL